MALSLDVQHVITSWGEGSVFDCGEEEDALTDLLIHLDDANEDAASWLRFDTSFAQATTAPARPHGPHSTTGAQPRSSSGAAPSASSKGGIAVPDAPAVPWWETCPQHGAIKGVKLEAPQGGGDAKSQAFFDMGAFAYSSAGGAFAPAAGQGHQQPEQPCVVPDNSACSVGASAAAAPPPNPYGLVPQAYMFMAPMMAVPSALAPAPLAAAAAAPMPLQGFMSETMRVRQECLRRYRDKKARRMYTKMVRYQLRKINADKRPRIKGRFVKKTEEELAAAAAGNSGPAAAAAGTAAARRRAPSTDDSAATVAKEGSESMQADYGVLSDDSS